jgi:hypothetical protein
LEGYVAPRRPSYGSLYETLLEKHNGDEEEATRALLERKEKQLDSIMFMSSPVLSKIMKRNTRGPMDMFVKRG